MATEALPPLERELADVDEAQRELMSLVDRLTAEPDAERQAELVRRIGERSDRLQRMCEVVEQKAREASREVRGKIAIQLTDAQRSEVKQRTGIVLDVVEITDAGGLLSAMPTMLPSDIMTYALAEAGRRVRRAEAQRAARAELERVREELASAPEQVRAEIERMLEDPAMRRAFGDPDRPPTEVLPESK